ncbi:hypothetical protein GJ744_003404 [Endocarpon pusillum]|uniref:Uncharacterized protein n=1 Tax=Endocarpon pusillum TaxID=364733 RepID=A0A8H7AED3_9EURO|nr:hypothetical protein GJ744_003404 [Endocarpon pusillum]
MPRWHSLEIENQRLDFFWVPGSDHKGKPGVSKASKGAAQTKTTVSPKSAKKAGARKSKREVQSSSDVPEDVEDSADDQPTPSRPRRAIGKASRIVELSSDEEEEETAVKTEEEETAVKTEEEETAVKTEEEETAVKTEEEETAVKTEEEETAVKTEEEETAVKTEEEETAVKTEEEETAVKTEEEETAVKTEEEENTGESIPAQEPTKRKIALVKTSMAGLTTPGGKKTLSKQGTSAG